MTLVDVEQLLRQYPSPSNLPVQHDYEPTQKPPDNKPCTQHKIPKSEGIKGLDFEDFAGTTESVRNKNWMPVDWCTMSSSCSIPWASAEKIDELFGRRFLHNPDAIMPAAPTAIPILDPSVKIGREVT